MPNFLRTWVLVLAAAATIGWMLWSLLYFVDWHHLADVISRYVQIFGCCSEVHSRTVSLCAKACRVCLVLLEAVVVLAATCSCVRACPLYGATCVEGGARATGLNAHRPANLLQHIYSCLGRQGGACGDLVLVERSADPRSCLPTCCRGLGHIQLHSRSVVRDALLVRQCLCAGTSSSFCLRFKNGKQAH